MIEKQGLDQILHFVSKRWIDLTREPNNKAMKVLPTDFWMNSVGGKAGNGRWVTMLMYTENEEDANSLKESQKKKSNDPDWLSWMQSQ